MTFLALINGEVFGFHSSWPQGRRPSGTSGDEGDQGQTGCREGLNLLLPQADVILQPPGRRSPPPAAVTLGTARGADVWPGEEISR